MENNMSKKATQLIQGDVISFKRVGNGEAWKTGTIINIHEDWFAGHVCHFAIIEVNGKRELLQITGSLNWNYIRNLAEVSA